VWLADRKAWVAGVCGCDWPPLFSLRDVCENDSMTTTPSPEVDAELTRQLSRAAPGEAVQGVFVLRTPPKQPYLTAAETRDQVHALLTAAQKHCGFDCEQVTIFENLQSFALQAPREMVQAVLASPQIASAMANAQPESLQIDPIRPSQGPAGERRTRGSKAAPKAPSPKRPPRKKSG